MEINEVVKKESSDLFKRTYTKQEDIVEFYSLKGMDKAIADAEEELNKLKALRDKLR